MPLEDAGIYVVQHEEESVLLRREIEKLTKNNSARLIAETEKLIQESKQLAKRIKSLGIPARSQRERTETFQSQSPSLLPVSSGKKGGKA
jgi:vacuolar-type H+-ATPase subunit F/Vma7